MANVTTMDSAEKNALKAPKNGRFKAEEAPEEAAPKHDPRLPKIGNPLLGSWEYLESITDDQWKQLTCYVYRTAPIIDRQSAGKEISIDKKGVKFDMKDILRDHGSGRYKFLLSYAPPSGGQWIRVRQWYETIFDLSSPPRVPLGEWMDNPANKDWEWARPMLKAEEVEREHIAAEKISGNSKQPQVNPVEQLKETIALAKGMMPADSSQAILLKLLEQSGPANMLTMAKELAEIKQPPAPPAQDNTILVLLLKHVLDKQAVTPADPIETTSKLLTGMKGIFEGMGVMPNGAAAAPVKMDTTGLVVQGASDILSKAIEQFGPYVPAAIDLFRHIKDRDLQIAQVSAQRGMNPAQPWQFQGGPNQPTVPHAPAPIAAPQPAPVEGAPMTPMVFLSKHKPLLDEMYPLFKHWFDDEDGYYVADWIIEHKGRDAYNAVRKDATVDMLMVIVANVPQLNVIFQPPDEAREFFTELLCDPDNRPPDEDEAPPDEDEAPEVRQ